MSEDIKKQDEAEEVVTEDAQQEVTEETTEEQAPLTKARTLSAINASLQQMSKEELDSLLDEAKSKKEDKAKKEAEAETDEAEDEEDEEEGDVEENIEPKTSSVKIKKRKGDDGSEIEIGEKEKKEAAKAKKEAKLKEDEAKAKKEAKAKEEAKQAKEDVDALAAGEDSLSEGFKEKAATIFEAALQRRAATATAELEEKYASDLEGEVKAIQEDVIDKVDGYLNYVVETWMKENEVAIEHSLRSEITESFISKLHDVFTEHYIDVPEDKVDIVDTLQKDLADAKDQLNKTTDDAKGLSEKVKAYEREAIVTEACEGLAATEAAKIAKLSEGIQADDNEDFTTKLATIKESYLNKDTTATGEDEVDAITEKDETATDKKVDPAMDRYLAALSGQIKTQS